MLQESMTTIGEDSNEGSPCDSTNQLGSLNNDFLLNSNCINMTFVGNDEYDDEYNDHRDDDEDFDVMMEDVIMNPMVSNNNGTTVETPMN